jgi:chemotaxis protein methyltransferase CheR
MTAPTLHPQPDAPAQGCEEREFGFTRGDFARISALLRKLAGIHLVESKSPLVYSRLVKRLRELGLRSFRDYCDLLEQSRNDAERRAMVTALSTNVTDFFREPHHFEHFVSQALPPLVERAKRGERLRFWSAGCSTGEEAYSLALKILSHWPEAADHDVRILGTDIDADVLRAAEIGVYSDERIASVAAVLRARHFARAARRTGEQSWRVGEALRRLTVFRELNLIQAWPMKGRFHAIFCRNVVIYFDEEQRGLTWRRLAAALEPGGYLYVGHAERVGAHEGRLRPVALTTYRLDED